MDRSGRAARFGAVWSGRIARFGAVISCEGGAQRGATPAARRRSTRRWRTARARRSTSCWPPPADAAAARQTAAAPPAGTAVPERGPAGSCWAAARRRGLKMASGCWGEGASGVGGGTRWRQPIQATLDRRESACIRGYDACDGESPVFHISRNCLQWPRNAERMQRKRRRPGVGEAAAGMFPSMGTGLPILGIGDDRIAMLSKTTTLRAPTVLQMHSLISMRECT